MLLPEQCSLFCCSQGDCVRVTHLLFAHRVHFLACALVVTVLVVGIDHVRPQRGRLHVGDDHPARIGLKEDVGPDQGRVYCVSNDVLDPAGGRGVRERRRFLGDVRAGLFFHAEDDGPTPAVAHPRQVLQQLLTGGDTGEQKVRLVLKRSRLRDPVLDEPLDGVDVPIAHGLILSLERVWGLGPKVTHTASDLQLCSAESAEAPPALWFRSTQV